MRSGTGWGTLGKIRDGSVSLKEVLDGSGDPRGGLGRVGGHSWRSGICRGTIGVSGTGCGTLKDFQDGSEDPWGGPGQFWGHSGRCGTGQETLEVRDGSGDPRGGPGWVEDYWGGSERVGKVKDRLGDNQGGS